MIKLLLSLVLVGAAHGAIAHVGTTTGHDCNSAATTCAITYSPVAGNFAWIQGYMGSSTVTISSVTDNGTGGCAAGWTKVVNEALNQESSGLYYCPSVGTGVTTITYNFSAATAAALVISEFSGLAASPLDQHPAVNSQTGTASFTSGNATTLQANELLIGTTAENDSSARTVTSVGSGWITAVNQAETFNGFTNAFSYQIVSSTGTYAFTGGWSASISQHIWTYITTFTAAASGPPANQFPRVLQ